MTEQKNNFFICLPSSVSSSDGFQNAITNYRTKLIEDLYTKDYYVGVKEFFIFQSFNNVDSAFKASFYFASEIDKPKGVSAYSLTTNTDNSITLTFTNNQTLTLTRYQVPLGHYEDLNDFTSRFKNQFPAHKQREIILKYDPVLNRIYLKIPPRCVLAWPSKLSSLGSLCGFVNDIYFEGTYFSRFEAFQFTGTEELNICVDIVNPQIFGNRFLPVICSLPKRGKRDEVVHYAFGAPQFFPVIKDIITHITVTITDSNGEEVKAQKGQIIVILEFKHETQLGA